MSWKLIEPLEDGTPVVYVGVHAVKWRREWGIPSVGFIENDASELAQVKAENERLREILEVCNINVTNVSTDRTGEVDNTDSEDK
jgi:hypothetical protein